MGWSRFQFSLPEWAPISTLTVPVKGNPSVVPLRRVAHALELRLRRLPGAHSLTLVTLVTDAGLELDLAAHGRDPISAWFPPAAAAAPHRVQPVFGPPAVAGPRSPGALLHDVRADAALLRAHAAAAPAPGAAAPGARRTVRGMRREREARRAEAAVRIQTRYRQLRAGAAPSSRSQV